MELTPKQQALERIKSAQNILLLTHKQPDGDAVGSILALTMALRKMDKQVTPVIQDPVPQVFNFLPGKEFIVTEFASGNDFIVAVNMAQTGLKKLGYKKDEESQRLLIMLTPERGQIRNEDIQFETTSYGIDLIVTLDCNSIDRLGDFYNHHTSLFYETPLVNIDHHADNEQFGTVNWVDVTATSTAEILVSLLEALGRETSLLDADIATNLLTGITTDTASFQNTSTTPKSLTVAAQLVALGARQQEIIQRIYKEHPISTLKLWGKALAKIKQRDDLHVLWTTLAKNDFEDANADETQTNGLIDNLLKTAQGVSFVFLLSEKHDGIHASFRSVEKGIPVSDIAKLLGGGGHEVAAGAEIDDTLSGAEERVLHAIETFWEKRGRPVSGSRTDASS